MLAVVVVLAVTFLYSSNSFAQISWYDAYVNLAGPAYGACRVKLTDVNGSFSQQSFTVPDAYKKEVLAVLLTAVSKALG